MQSVLVYDYRAQGEGSEIRIFFRNSSATTDELAVELMTERLGPHFSQCVQLLPLETIEFNKDWMGVIKCHVPILHKYITGERDYAITIDYKSLVNYS